MSQHCHRRSKCRADCKLNLSQTVTRSRPQFHLLYERLQYSETLRFLRMPVTTHILVFSPTEHRYTFCLSWVYRDFFPPSLTSSWTGQIWFRVLRSIHRWHLSICYRQVLESCISWSIRVCGIDNWPWTKIWGIFYRFYRTHLTRIHS